MIPDSSPVYEIKPSHNFDFQEKASFPTACVDTCSWTLQHSGPAVLLNRFLSALIFRYMYMTPLLQR